MARDPRDKPSHFGDEIVQAVSKLGHLLSDKYVIRCWSFVSELGLRYGVKQVDLKWAETQAYI
jgi:hypothetical protein